MSRSPSQIESRASPSAGANKSALAGSDRSFSRDASRALLVASSMNRLNREKRCTASSPRDWWQSTQTLLSNLIPFSYGHTRRTPIDPANRQIGSFRKFEPHDIDVSRIDANNTLDIWIHMKRQLVTAITQAVQFQCPLARSRENHAGASQ
jgi:hypothetical protein